MAYGSVFGDDEDLDGGADGARRQLGAQDWQSVLSDPGVAVHIDQGARASLFRAGVVVVGTADFADPRLLSNLADLGIDWDEYEREARSPYGFGLLHLGAGIDVVGAVGFLRSLDGRRPLQVGADHLFSPAPARMLGPVSLPTAVAATEDQFEVREEFTLIPARVRAAVIDTGLVAAALGEDPLLFHVTDPDLLGPGSFDPMWDEANEALAHWAGGHGTFAAGVMAEASAGSVLLEHHNVCTLHGDRQVPLVADSAMAMAVAAALDGGCRVVNLSLAGPTAHDRGSLALALTLGRTGPVDDERSPADSDAVVVAAAGNEATSQPMFPAALKGVVAVGAVDGKAAGRAPFSNHGPWVDCASLGIDLFGPYVSGAGAPQADGSRDRFDGWALWSGTSFASAWVAGRIARAMADGIGSARVAAATVLAAGLPLVPGAAVGPLIT